MKPGEKLQLVSLKNGLETIIRVPKFGDWEKLMVLWNSVIQEKDYLNTRTPVTEYRQKKNMRKYIRNIKAQKRVTLVAETDGKIIGSIQAKRCKGNMDHVYDFGMIIDKKFRGLGLGTFLIKGMEKQIKIQGGKIIKLGCMATNSVAIKTYEKNGYLEYARMPKGIQRRGRRVDLLHFYKEVK